MLDQSQVVFWYVLSASIGLIAIMVVFLLYYLIRLLKNAVYTVEKFTNVLKKADEVLDMAKDKLQSGGTYLAMGVQAVTSLIEMFGEKATKKRKK